MSFPVLTIKDFVHSITGLWYNRISLNKYMFTPNVHDPAVGEVSIIQHGADAEINLSIRLEMQGSSLVVLVEGAAYQVSIPDLPEKSLAITLAPGKIVHLYKHL